MTLREALEGSIEIEEARERVTWRPIETAPWTSETILISGRYPNGLTYVETSFRHVGGGHFNGRKIDPPTHWMPLPTPPEAS